MSSVCRDFRGPPNTSDMKTFLQSLEEAQKERSEGDQTGPMIVCALLCVLGALLQGEAKLLYSRVSVEEGRTLILRCAFPERESSDMQWLTPRGYVTFLNSEKVLKDRRFQVIKSSRKRLVISISNITGDDEGVYTCLHYSPPVKTKEVNVTVWAAPSNPVIDVAPIPGKSRRDDIVLNCSTSGGRPCPRITWLIGHTELSGNRKVSLEGNDKKCAASSALKINAFTHRSTVTCVVRHRGFSTGNATATFNFSNLLAATKTGNTTSDQTTTPTPHSAEVTTPVKDSAGGYDVTTTRGGWEDIHTEATSVTPPERTTTSVTPPERKTTSATPPERTTTSVTPPERTATSVTPPERTATSVTPPERTTTSVTPPERTATSVTPPERTTTSATPPERTTTSVTPPERKTTSVTPPERTTTSVTPPERTTTSATPPERTTTSATPPERTATWETAGTDGEKGNATAVTGFTGGETSPDGDNATQQNQTTEPVTPSVFTDGNSTQNTEIKNVTKITCSRTGGFKASRGKSNSTVILILVSLMMCVLLVIVHLFLMKLRKAHKSWKKDNENSDQTLESNKSKSNNEDAPGPARNGHGLPPAPANQNGSGIKYNTQVSLTVAESPASPTGCPTPSM